AQDFESGVQRAFHAASPANRPHWFAPRLPACQSRRSHPFSTSGLRGYQASPRDFSGKVSLCVLETTLRGAARLRKHPSREPTSDPENNPCLRSPPRGQQGNSNWSNNVQAIQHKTSHIGGNLRETP